MTTKKARKRKFISDLNEKELSKLMVLLNKLSNEELKLLTENIGIHFLWQDDERPRDAYEDVIDEAYVGDFYREYAKIIKAREK